MRNKCCCRPVWFCLCRIVSTFFMLVGIAAVVFCVALFQVRELSQIANQDFFPHSNTRPSLLRGICKPCSEKNETYRPKIRKCEEEILAADENKGKFIEIACNVNSSTYRYRNKSGDMVLSRMQFRDPCLKTFIQDHCYDGFRVPRVVHYVWFTKHSMDIYSFLSVLSAAKILKPCVILFHADYLPFGPYWKKLLATVHNIVFVQRQAPERIFGKRLGFIQHKSDIARIEALKEYGGIYMDCDQFALKSFNNLRNYDFVMGHENSQNLGNSVMVAVPNASFLEIWFNSYRTYNPTQWGIHSTFVPLRLAKENPSLIHIENNTLITPDLGGIESVYSGRFNWTNNYAIHLYSRWVKKSFTIKQLRVMDTALGEISRLILYGTPTLCSS